MENIYVMLFNTIENVCLNSKIEQSNETPIILSNIFDTMHKAGSIPIAAINMALIDLISKLILSDNNKGIYMLQFFI